MGQRPQRGGKNSSKEEQRNVTTEDDYEYCDLGDPTKTTDVDFLFDLVK